MSCSGVSEALWVDREGVVLRKRQCTLFWWGRSRAVWWAKQHKEAAPSVAGLCQLGTGLSG
jgi:hypothetical protein